MSLHESFAWSGGRSASWSFLSVGALLAAALCCSTPAMAALVYLDATSGVSGNTSLADGSTFSPPLNGTTGADNNWEQRTTFASSGNVYESSGETAEDAPELRTMISGLVPGTTYTAYVHFWDGSGTAPDWNVRAGFVSGSLTLYANSVASDAADLGATGAGLASALSYATAPTVFTEADRTMYAGLVGIQTADANGQIAIYIDDLPSTIGVNNRTWYDGVSYERYVPEPSSLALLLVAIPLALAGRRRPC